MPAQRMSPIVSDDIIASWDKLLADSVDFTTRLSALKAEVDAKQGIIKTLDGALGVRSEADSYAAKQRATADAIVSEAKAKLSEAQTIHDSAKAASALVSDNQAAIENAHQALQTSIQQHKDEAAQRKKDWDAREAAIALSEKDVKAQQSKLRTLQEQLRGRLKALEPVE